jgi:hypothetical protein
MARNKTSTTKTATPTAGKVSNNRLRMRARSRMRFAKFSHIDSQQFERAESDYYRLDADQLGEIHKTYSKLEDDYRLYRNMISEAGQHLAVKHGVGNVPAHERLMNELANTRWTVRSLPIFERGAWEIPSDLTPWKKTRPKLRVLASRLRSIAKALHEIADDPLLFAAIRHVDDREQFPDVVPGLFNLANLVQAAAEIEGHKGNRPYPRWTIQATKQCKEFWRNEMHQEPKAFFKENHTTEPANPFSSWFCDVMDKVAEFTTTECQTMLRRK